MTKSIINSAIKQTNWYVITGGPSSGKTTTVNLLKERGHITTIEHARHLVSYKKIFILNFLPLVNDYARNEDGIAQKRIHELLIEVYESLTFPIVKVPVLSPEVRVNFILENL